MNNAEWDIRLQCTICGHRSRRHRADGDPPFGHEPQSTCETVCYECTSQAGYPDDGDVVTTHFVDFATDKEMDDPRWRDQ